MPVLAGIWIFDRPDARTQMDSPVSTNDGLSGSAANIGALLARRGYYFVPFTQDDPERKPHSLVAEFELIPECIDAMLEGRQIRPLFR